MDIYSFAIAFCHGLLAPIEQSTVFFRMMLLVHFINSRQIVLIYAWGRWGCKPSGYGCIVYSYLIDEYFVQQIRNANWRYYLKRAFNLYLKSFFIKGFFKIFVWAFFTNYH